MRTVAATAGGSVIACAFALAACRPSNDDSRPQQQASGARITRVDSLLRAGDSAYRRSPDTARALWTMALNDATTAADSISIAKALTGLGQAARLLGDFAASRQLGEQALAMKLRRGMTTELFRSYNALGLLAWSEGRLSDAAPLLERAAEAARLGGDSISMVKAELNAGVVAQDLGRFQLARRSMIRARDAALRFGDSVTYARALNNLGALDAKLGDPLSAIRSLNASREVARATGDAVTEVNARGQLAVAYDELGEPQRAFALLDSALAMARRDGRRQEVAESLKLLADMYLDAGDHRRALDYYRAAVALTDSLGQPEERGTLLRNEARAHAALGNGELALARASEALRVHRAGAFAYPEVGDLLVLAALAERGGRHADANAFLGEARGVARRLNAPSVDVRVSLAEAGVAGAAGQWSRVLRSLDAVGGSLPLAGAAAEASAYSLRARAYAELGRVEAAVAAGRQALAAVERIRGRYSSGELRTSYISDKSNIYAQQTLLLLRLGRTDEAFGVADAARGRALLEHLSAARAGVADGARVRPLVEQEELIRRIDALVARLQERETPPPRERSATFAGEGMELRDSLLAARAEYEALVARSATVAAPEAGLMPGAGAVSPVRIRSSLQPGEVLLEYFVTADRLIVFAMNGSGLSSVVTRETAQNLASRVRLARELLQDRDQHDRARAVLRALHDILIKPVEDHPAHPLRDARRILIVPHGALAYLPFAALLDSSGRFAVERYSILYLPTSASLPTLRSPARAGAAMSPSFLSVETFAPFPDSLAATRHEALNVARAASGGTAHLGSRATEARLRRALERAGIVHVATHARMNKRNPLFSRVELAGERAGPSEDNGGLDVHETLGIRVGAQLVFLSGCETALGDAWSTRFDTGEDYTTIAQALLYAGARNVIATLWRIDDAAAAKLAEAFYAGLASQAPPEALAHAQRQLIADKRLGSPYYWAAYTLSGGGALSLRGRANIAAGVR